MSTPSIEMERPNPAVTLRGFHVPKQLIERIEKQQDALRRELREKMLAVQKCVAKQYLDSEEVAGLDAAVKWLGGNAGRIGEMDRVSAFFSVLGAIEEKSYYMDLFEAGFALSRLAKGVDLLDGSFRKIQDGALEDLKHSGGYGMKQDVELAAALGVPKAIRVVMFWESMGMVSGIVERIEALHPESMEIVRKEMEEGRKMSGTGLQKGGGDGSEGNLQGSD